MKKCFVIILMLLTLFSFSSCKEEKADIPLFQKLDEILLNTDYYAYKIDEEVVNNELMDNGLNKKYEIDEAFYITCGLRAYSFKKGKSKDFKQYLLNHTLAGHLAYATKGNILFTGYKDVSSEALNLFEIELEEGHLQFSNDIKSTQNSLGASKTKVLEEDYDAVIIHSYEEYQKIQNQITYVSSYYDEEKEITKDTFKDQDVLFVQLSNHNRNNIFYEISSLCKQKNELQISITFKRSLYDFYETGYFMMFFSIDKNLNANDCSLLLYQSLTGIQDFFEDI